MATNPRRQKSKRVHLNDIIDDDANDKDVTDSKDTNDSKKTYDKYANEADRTDAKERARNANKSKVLDDDDEDDDDKSFMSRIDWGDVTKKTLIPIAIASLIFIPVGCAIGSSGNNKPAAPQVQTVDNIEGVNRVLDKSETLKDDQIRSLNKQLAALNDSTRGISAEEAKALGMMNADTVKPLDPFFDAVIGIDRNASKSELTTHQKNLSEFMTNDASTSTLYDFLNGSSPAKQLNSKISKAGPIIATWIGSADKDTREYLVAVPILNEKGLYKAMYDVKMLRDKIDKITYLGIMNDSNVPLETARKDATSDIPGGPSNDPNGVASPNAPQAPAAPNNTQHSSNSGSAPAYTTLRPEDLATAAPDAAGGKFSDNPNDPFGLGL